MTRYEEAKKIYAAMGVDTDAAIAKLKDIPVIFLTGISDKKHIMDVVELKPAAYFLKPPVYMPIFLEIQKLIGE